MKFRTQRVAYWYLAVAALLFLLQVADGLIIASQYIYPDLFRDFFPFNVGRTWHLNLLVLWLVIGFMGATYYVVPEESGRELWSPRLAYLQLAILFVTGVAALTGFVAANFFPSLWLTEGREYIEAPRWADWLIVLAVLIFAINNGWTMVKRTRPFTATVGVLTMGMIGLALMYLAGMKTFSNVTVDQFFWWWVVHLWVEGTWELIAAALMAFLMVRLTGVDREVVEKWLYVEVGLVLFTGILGTGHHYYWIGTPSYWLIIGGVFSALEPIPIMAMVVDAWRMTRVRHRPHPNPNPVSFTWAVGSVIGHFFGAAVWGFAHTLPQVNKWTHGTQVTPAHGHFAFYGAYVMLIIALTYYMVPEIKGMTARLGRRGLWAFWLISSGVVGMVLSLTIAGIVQVYMQRMAGLDFIFVKTTYMSFWFALRAIFGGVTALGVVVYVWDLVSLGREKERNKDG
ncbi:MAG: cbb3-type cytochrome c oxidase subunit I [Chloroflexota bacterium]